MSKLIDLTSNFSDRFNQTELDYRNQGALKDERTNTIEKWKQRVQNGRLGILKQLKKKGIEFHGDILELGAGMCWFSSELSKINKVKNVYALEFSKILLSEVAPHIIDYLKADKKKIIRVIGDFYKLDLDKKFDFVVFDAALHHVNHLSVILTEIEKVLKPQGKIIAIREPVLPDWRKNEREKFGEEDRKHGVTEMIFTRSEWESMFKDRGYRIDFLSYAPTNKITHKLLPHFPFSILNKRLFGNYIFIIQREL